MANDFISREGVKRSLESLLASYKDYGAIVSMNYAIRAVEEVPAADVAEVVHARWEHLGGLCSACGRESAGYCGESSEAWLSPYCPECGAKMDLPGGYGGYKPRMDGGEPHAEQSNTQHEKSNV